MPSSGPLLEDMYGHWTKAGKMVVVEALLRLWAKQHHRVLLFTQTKQVCVLGILKCVVTYLLCLSSPLPA